jgi:hypothetical protein
LEDEKLRTITQNIPPEKVMTTTEENAGTTVFREWIPTSTFEPSRNASRRNQTSPDAPLL